MLRGRKIVEKKGMIEQIGERQEYQKTTNIDLKRKWKWKWEKGEREKEIKALDWEETKIRKREWKKARNKKLLRR